VSIGSWGSKDAISKEFHDVRVIEWTANGVVGVVQRILKNCAGAVKIKTVHKIAWKYRCRHADRCEFWLRRRETRSTGLEKIRERPATEGKTRMQGF
jgi:hypothetical protein